jgi:hypothetical protein
MTRQRSKSNRSEHVTDAARAVAPQLTQQPDRRTMKIAVINFSGNVGKTTIAHHLLAPRLEGAEVISIESINSDGTERAALRGKQFDELQDRMMTMRHVVVDVGASNVEDFVALMQSYDGSHEDFDMFIVPTVPPLKQQLDTIATLDQLSALGIASDRIRLLFNCVDPKSNLDKTFGRLFTRHAAVGGFVLDPSAVIYENPIYEKIKTIGKTITDVNSDTTDYVAWNARAMEDDTPEPQRAHIRQMVAIKRLATRVTREHDDAFRLLVH